ncbi:hypothetical protein [Streptomyces tendae]|uniref:hypothetical protein n=1 Tax=Streptomyces tendae TaxID=1932 RepID=UPI0037A0634B
MGSYDSKARRARLRLAAVGVSAVAALALVGTLAITTLSGGEDEPGKVEAKSPPDSSASGSPAPTASAKEFTPATAARIPLLKATSNTDGIGTGFEHSALGATSAAVSYWEDLDFLDDVIAEKQWSAIAASDSPETVDQGVSEVRKVREGVGLPPSGGTPDGITFSTNVKAALTRSLEPSGDVVNVWMVFDRFATIKDKGTDGDPLRDETTNLILKWQNGDWKVTTEAKYTAKVRGPRAYDPDSKFAWMDGWREVSDG